MNARINQATAAVRFLAAIALAFAIVLPVLAQRGSITAPIDPELEASSRHNLDVGRQYFKKKAWTGALGRLEEIVATNPEFTKIDEVYYLAGVCYARTKEVKLAREMLQKVVDEHTESEFVKRAREELAKLVNQAGSDAPRSSRSGSRINPPGR